MDSDDLHELAEYTKKCELCKRDLNSCNVAFAEANSLKPSESFWYTTGGSVTIVLLSMVVGGLIVKAWDQQSESNQNITAISF